MSLGEDKSDELCELHEGRCGSTDLPLCRLRNRRRELVESTLSASGEQLEHFSFVISHFLIDKRRIVYCFFLIINVFYTLFSLQVAHSYIPFRSITLPIDENRWQFSFTIIIVYRVRKSIQSIIHSIHYKLISSQFYFWHHEQMT